MTEKIYNKACIYKIFCKDEKIKDFYIGSTISSLHTRLAGHKTALKKNNNKLYNFIKNNGGFKNFNIKIIQEYPTNNLYKLRDIENEYILIFKPSLNSNKPFIHPSSKKEYLKQYRIDNKERRKKWLKKHSDIINCECGSKIKFISTYTHKISDKHIDYLRNKRLNKCVPVST